MNKTTILNNTSNYHEEFIASLKKPKAANLYLGIAMEEYHQDGDVEALLIALRNIAASFYIRPRTITQLITWR